jgi:AraC-like DNA-binding protein
MISTQQEEERGSRPMGRAQQVERAGGAAGGLQELGQIHPMLSEIVDQIADWDFPDGDMAGALRTKILPSTTPWLIAQYRAPMGSDHHFGTSGYRQQRYCHVATMVRTGVATLRPSGPLGILTIRLKPEAAARLMGERMQAFADEKIELGNLIRAGDLSLLEEMLMEAPDSAARFARIESILLQNLRQSQPDAVVCRAAQRLRRNPSLSVQRLAAQLDVSERHLSRSFRAMFGASPKQICTGCTHRKDCRHAARRIGLGRYRVRLRLCRSGPYDQRFPCHCRRAATTGLPHDWCLHRLRSTLTGRPSRG